MSHRSLGPTCHLSRSLSHTHTRARARATTGSCTTGATSLPAQVEPLTQGGRSKGDTARHSRQCHTLWPSESLLPWLSLPHSSKKPAHTETLSHRPVMWLAGGPRIGDPGSRHRLPAMGDSPRSTVSLLAAPQAPQVLTAMLLCRIFRGTDCQSCSPNHAPTLTGTTTHPVVLCHTQRHAEPHTPSTQAAHMQTPCDTRSHKCASGEQRSHSTVTHAASGTSRRTLSHACAVTNAVPQAQTVTHHTHTHTDTDTYGTEEEVAQEPAPGVSCHGHPSAPA